MLEVYTLQEREKWDSIVRSFSDYDTYWLSGYVKAFYLHGDGEPLLFYYESSDTRGINVVMKRDISNDPKFKDILPNNTYYDFSTPYGYGGWIIEGEDKESLFHEYIKWVSDNNIISEFVRFHPILGNHKQCKDHYEIVQLGEVVHMDLSSPEVIWQNVTSKNRNVIRKAKKNGVTIYNGRFPEIFETFRDIYNATMDKDHASSYYYFDQGFYNSILQDLPYNSELFFAVKDGVVIAASIIIFANHYINYHLSGSLKEYSSLAATNLLLYEVALWGNANGFDTFYLGGGVGSGEDSLFKFKRAFYRGNLNHFFIGKAIYDKQRYAELCRLRNIGESNYFPQYRA